MFKWFKKHKLKFLSCFALCLCLSLFGFMAFSSKVYAWSIDNSGNLVGDNLFYIDEPYYNDYGGVVKEYNPETQILSLNGVNTIAEGNGLFKEIDLSQGTYYLQSFYINGTSNGAYRLVAHNASWSWQSTLYIGTVNSITSFTLNISDRVYINFYGDLNTFYNLDNYISLSTTQLYNWEPYGTWYSQLNYDELQNEIDELNIRNTQLNNVLFNGWLGYCSSILVTDNTDNTFRRFSFEQLVENNVISNGYFNYYQCVHLLTNFNSSHNYTISFSPRIYDANEEIYLNYRSFFIQFEDNSFTSYNLLQLVDINGYVVSYQNLNGLTVSSDDLLNEIRNTSFNGLIDTINLSFVPSGVSSNSFSSNSDFANGYLEGQNASTQQFQQIIDNQNNTISGLESIINDKNASINQLQSLYNNLLRRYNAQLEGDNFINLFFTIAETPFASFKQIWNVDFLGVNLAGFVTGILFIGLIIWIVKKIF